MFVYVAELSLQTEQIRKRSHIVTDQLEQNLYREFENVLRYSEFTFSEQTKKLFVKYFYALLKKNEVMNLTAITDPPLVAELHLFDSLTLLSVLPSDLDLSLIDVGTGAGLPGIPLKIARPEINLCLLDATKKRLNFLDECLTSLCLQTKARTVHARAEDAARKSELREKFDIATARAVAPLNILAEYCLPFVKLGGYFIAMKGQADSEIEQAEKAINLLGGDIADIWTLKLPISYAERSLILIQKIAATPKRFPRKAGTPKSDPLT
ncbi:MAG TPA: 16S rRNA (guanine(527)-N(7))-methyltransferase RsmG [Clostridiaceae bacterium]|nr:16S rRNA (guanine(527)-N(7))-methyltransferase RsmG [Clostridiaceae bacterium]